MLNYIEKYPLHERIIGRGEYIGAGSLNKLFVIPFEMKYNNAKYYSYKILIVILSALWIWGCFHFFQDDATKHSNFIIDKIPFRSDDDREKLREFLMSVLPLFTMFSTILVIKIFLILFFNLYDVDIYILRYYCNSVYGDFYLLIFLSIGMLTWGGVMARIGSLSYIMMLITTLFYRFYFENENELFNFMMKIAKDSPINLDDCNAILREYTIYLKDREKLDEDQITDSLYSLRKFKYWFKKNPGSLKAPGTIDPQFLNYMDKRLGS